MCWLFECKRVNLFPKLFHSIFRLLSSQYFVKIHNDFIVMHFTNTDTFEIMHSVNISLGNKLKIFLLLFFFCIPTHNNTRRIYETFFVSLVKNFVAACGVTRKKIAKFHRIHTTLRQRTRN